MNGPHAQPPYEARESKGQWYVAGSSGVNVLPSILPLGQTLLPEGLARELADIFNKYGGLVPADKLNITFECLKVTFEEYRRMRDGA